MMRAGKTDSGATVWAGAPVSAFDTALSVCLADVRWTLLYG